MKTFEEYKRAVAEQPSAVLADKLIAQAALDGCDAWALAELAGVRAELWV